MGYLKSHPFAIEAYFKQSMVLTFAFPNSVLAPLIPECLELDTYQDKWAFLAVAMVDTKYLRPKGFPKFLGNDFFLTGYRIFVRYKDVRGKSLRGLYILKSETNKWKMKCLGNMFSHYDYNMIDIHHSISENVKTISSHKANFHVNSLLSDKEPALPKHSPFLEWKEARRFAGPLPFTFAYNKDKMEVNIIEGVRKNWKPKAVKIDDYHFDFLNQENFKEGVLASAFVVNDIAYYWKKGRKEKWTKA